MKIALIHYRLIFKGGLETRLKNYIEYFDQEGHQVHVICAKIANDVTVPSNVKIHKLKLGLMPKWFRTAFFDFKLKLFMKKNSFDFSLSLGRTSCQHAVLAPSNHLGYLRALNKKPKGFKDKIQIKLDRRSYENSNLIFAASKMIQDELIELYNINQNKIKILNPPLNESKFDPGLKKQQFELKNKLGFSNSKITFLFVSVNHKLKGLDLLINIFNELNPSKYELIVVGRKYKDQDTPNIKYLDYVKETNEIYAAADYLIHPSKYDAFGQIISESLQSGTPVIISHQTGAKEIVTPHLGIVINSLKTEYWVKTLEGLNKSDFSIPPNFAFQNDLTVKQHCESMLAIWQKLNS